MKVLLVISISFGFIASAFCRSWLAVPTVPVGIVPEQSQINFLNRIVNGSPAAPNQFPWFASIRSHTQLGLQSICGGSIIAPTWVLTAAHCTRGFVSYTVGFGSNNLNTPIIAMHTTEVIEHANFNRDTLNNDIALIGLPCSLSYSAGIQPLRLPTLQQAYSDQLYTTQVRVCGYGRVSDVNSAVSPTLNWIDGRIISNSQCTQTYGPSVVIPSTICALGWEINEQSTCNGDSGGPLVMDEGGIWVQVGIVSFVSNQGCASGHPSGYVRTSAFLNWISMHTGIPIQP